MKKIVTIVAVALFGALVLPSCKKDYTCTCTIAGQTQPYPYENTTKKDAKAACEALSSAAAVAGGSCSLD
jgi:hypothetical protein